MPLIPGLNSSLFGIESKEEWVLLQEAFLSESYGKAYVHLCRNYPSFGINTFSRPISARQVIYVHFALFSDQNLFTSGRDLLWPFLRSENTAHTSRLCSSMRTERIYESPCDTQIIPPTPCLLPKTVSACLFTHNNTEIIASVPS